MRSSVKVATAGTAWFLFAAGALLSGAPAALANGVPSPEPVPVPEPSSGTVSSGEGGCQAGQAMVDGNCVPAMTGQPSTAGGQGSTEFPQRTSQVESSSSTSYTDPAYMAPNINGDPCTGYWESVACYAMNFDTAEAVQPRSSLSSSP